MNQDGVNIAFELMLDEIQAVIQQLNDEGAAFFKNGEYSKAQKLSLVGDALGQFRVKLEQLKAEWNRGFDAATRRRVRSDQIGTRVFSHQKRRKTILAITFPDGTRICESVAARSFVMAIEKVGVERVKQLDMNVCGVPLIATQRIDRYGKSQWPCGKFYVMTHSSTESKKEALQRIAKELSLQLRVEIVRTGL